MSGLLASLEHATGGLWPYLVVIIFGFLPTEVWRTLGVLAGRGLDENSEVFRWVRFVATALVTAVVAKLLLNPQGALMQIPLWGGSARWRSGSRSCWRRAGRSFSASSQARQR